MTGSFDDLKLTFRRVAVRIGLLEWNKRRKDLRE